MTTCQETELELGRKATEAFLDEIYGMLQRDDIDRIPRRLLTVARDIGRVTRTDLDFIKRIIIAINNINEVRKNRQMNLINDDTYFAHKNKCITIIIEVAHDIAELLGSASAGGVGSRAFSAAGGE